MNVQELRIGNFVDTINRSIDVHLPNNSQMKVGEVKLFKVMLYKIKLPFVQQIGMQFDIKDLHPVPLTEEWLIKFGFEGHSMDMWKVLPIGNGLELHVDCVVAGDFVNACLTKGGHDGIPGKDHVYMYLSECSHVHTLQNLYFALTGTELTLSE